MLSDPEMREFAQEEIDNSKDEIINFESKLPIEKIILFYGVGNLKERLLLYINDWWKKI